MNDLYTDGMEMLADDPTPDLLGAIARNNGEPLESCPEGIDRQAWINGWLTMDRTLNPPCRGGSCG
jgi:hypothetical protein